MATYDIQQDAPGLLRAESLSMTVAFDRTSDTTARISWNIPTPVAGCSAETQAYNGIIITLDTTPANVGKIPLTGRVYSADATADASLFAGDTIGTSKVIGAFYGDKVTTYVDVTGLSANTPYYITGYPVDAQYRYFIEGVHAYSQDIRNRGADGTHGSQVAVFNYTSTSMGIQATDATGLASQQYDFTIQLGVIPAPRQAVDSVDCNPTPYTTNITVNGDNASTYSELVAEINKKFALLDNPAQSANPPNTGSYFWNSSEQKLYTWNGYTHTLVSNVIVQSTDPSVVVDGTFWYDTTNGSLYVRTSGVWDSPNIVEFASDPTSPTADQTYWFDGTTGYLWNGVTWCSVPTVVSSIDPSVALVPPAGSFWHDTSKGVLYRYNTTTLIWTEASVIQYVTDPNSLPVGAYWYNETTNVLYVRSTGSVWSAVSNVSVAENAPTTPAPGKFWYNPSTMTLYQRNTANTAWDELDVVAFPTDPTVREFCDLWWNVTTETLNVWDALASTWVAASTVYEQTYDPTTTPSMDEGSLWYDTATATLYVWVNACFKAVAFIDWASNPKNIANGSVWHNTSTDKWYLRVSGSWSLVTPVSSPVDPSAITAGLFWYDTTTNALSMWNGVSWVTVSYASAPLTPHTNTLWFNSSTSTLMYWNGSTWVQATPRATAEIDCNGNILFTDTTVGSLSFVLLKDGTLFAALTAPSTFHDPKPGTDNVSDTPSYEELGIGTDGSGEERKQLQTEVRYELGYPTVDVELTAEQIDYAISKALGELRARSGLAYKRDYFFMRINADTQIFRLSNKIQGMNKIVDVIGVYRLTSSFLSSAHGAGVYGQIILQNLYNMGTFDLLSYHIMSEYTKTLEMLFAGRLTFTWNEQKRELFIHHRFAMTERLVCIEATVERTEQDLLTDRYARPWLRRYALATSRIMLAEARGKYSTLPSASGGVTLNASDLRQQGEQEIAACLEEIHSFEFDRPEEYGMGSAFLFG